MSFRSFERRLVYLISVSYTDVMMWLDQVKSLQADNLKLYEKVRYMQSYREDSATRPSTLDPLPSGSAGRADDMSKYRAR